MRSHGRGYTLIELLTVIAILAILLSITPSFGKIIAENRQQSQIAELNRILELARNNAITTGAITTLCGSNDGLHCDNDVQLPILLIFADRNLNHQFDAADQLIYRSELSSQNWRWRGSGNRPYLRFRADGSVMEWGRFTLCPTHGLTYASQLVLNFVGRPYIARLEGDELLSSAICS